MPDAAPAKPRPKKCAPLPGTKSGGFAFLPRTRCIASLHGWKSVAFRKPEASAAARRPPVLDLLQKKKAASSPREHSGRRFTLYGDTRCHDSFSPSGSNFSATSLPSAFFCGSGFFGAGIFTRPFHAALFNSAAPVILSAFSKSLVAVQHPASHL